MMNNRSITLRLIVLSFLEFAVWGAYLTSLGRYLGNIGLGNQIKWFFAMQGIVSIFMPTLMGILADRKVQAQKVLSLCHLLAGLFMIAAGYYCKGAGTGIAFGPLFTLYSISVAFFMPTIALVNSVSYNALETAGKDPVKDFPPIRVFGTVGFIISMLCVNWIKIGGTAMQDSYTQLTASGILSLVMCAYALTMPPVPTKDDAGSKSITEALGLKAFTLFKDRQFAIFFIFSMLLGVSLQITNGYANPFITSFKDVAEYADTFGAQHANILISLSQISETCCILLIPFCLKRFGIKNVMMIAMFAWMLRFGLFGAGDPGSGLWMLVLSCIVYGVAFDFFNISGALFVDQNTDAETRSSAQGLFMIMTNGLGATIGTLSAQAVVNTFVFNEGVTDVIAGWRTSWYIFAGYSLAVLVLFAVIFRPKKPHTRPTDTLSPRGEGKVSV